MIERAIDQKSLFAFRSRLSGRGTLRLLRWSLLREPPSPLAAHPGHLRGAPTGSIGRSISLWWTVPPRETNDIILPSCRATAGCLSFFVTRSRRRSGLPFNGRGYGPPQFPVERLIRRPAIRSHEGEASVKHAPQAWHRLRTTGKFPAVHHVKSFLHASQIP